MQVAFVFGGNLCMAVASKNWKGFLDIGGLGVKQESEGLQFGGKIAGRVFHVFIIDPIDGAVISGVSTHCFTNASSKTSFMSLT